MYTGAVCTLVDALNRLPQTAQSVRIELNLSYSQFPVRLVLHLVERIWRGLDSDFVASSEGPLKNSLKRLEDALKPLSFGLFHDCLTPLQLR